jgi:tetratricopeptide (TPR) repeat protein
LERVRQPAKPIIGETRTRFINPPPLIAPTWFQDRHIETRLIGDFLKDDALRLMTIVGRGGIGKSALTCRLLRSLEAGQLPDDGGPLPIDGIVYLSDARSFHRVNFPDLYASLSQLLPEETRRPLDSVYKNPQSTARQTMEALLAAFPSGRTVVLLDNFEDEVAIETGSIKNAELAEALNALLELPPHALKVLVTTRVAPRDLASTEPGRQRRLDLDAGLDRPYAENILRAMDADGKLGLRNADEALLARARERTRGFPRALEHLFGILSADRDTKLQEILDRTIQLLPDQVTAALVGEAFSRLDLTAQRVMQALAIFRYPVPPPAVDYLLQPFIRGVDSGPVLSRLVNMQFVRRDAGRYFLHQIDRDYAESRIAEGHPADRYAEAPPFTRFALQQRAAEWFKLARKPRQDQRTLDDLAAQLAEFELRYVGQDWDTAAAVLLEIDFDHLILWGHYRLLTELHERLQGKIVDGSLAQNSALNLGTGYRTIGQFQRAIECYERALSLAREAKVREDEGASLSGLASCYAELGHNDQAVAYLEDALRIAREVKDRGGEATRLGNLGNRYSDQGQFPRAIEYTEQALAIFREIKDRPGEALDLCNLGEMYADLGQTEQALECLHCARAVAKKIGYRLAEANSCTNLGWLFLNQGHRAQAANQFRQAAEIADDIANIEFQHLARLGLAVSSLSEPDLPAAREMAEAARKHNFPRSNHLSSAVLGIVALRQGDRQTARAAFATALHQSAELLSRAPQRYAALDTQGLALCGLSLCEDPSHIPAAKEAYQAARAITSAPGIVARVHRLLDALAPADSTGILAEVHP